LQTDGVATLLGLECLNISLSNRLHHHNTKIRLQFLIHLGKHPSAKGTEKISLTKLEYPLDKRLLQRLLQVKNRL